MSLHPVLAALKQEGTISSRDLQFLIDNGRPYQGVSLPSGIRQRKPGRCFEVADELEEAGRGQFVRGFALRPDGSMPLKHAWVSRDGDHAIDPSWTQQPRCHYFGIPGRTHEGRLKAMTNRSVITIPSFNFGFGF